MRQIVNPALKTVRPPARPIQRHPVGRLAVMAGLVSLLFLSGLRDATAQFARDLPASLPSALNADSVFGRPRPEYDPVGGPLGGFHVFSEIRATTGPDDNVLRTDKYPRSDFLFRISPQVSVRSDWGRHYLGFDANITRFQYSELSSENKTEWRRAGNGRADLTDLDLVGLLSHVSTFQRRTSRDQVGAAKPTPFRQSDATLDLAYNPAWLGLKRDAEFQRFNYSDTVLLKGFGGGVRNNHDRDHDEYLVSTTALAEFSPGYGDFVRPSYRLCLYDLDTGRAAGRDLEGHDLDAGLDFLVSRLITREADLGYRHIDFQGPQYHDLSPLDFGGALHWYATELLDLSVKVARTPSATTQVGASMVDDWSVEVGVDYEFRRKVIVQPSGSFIATQFEGITRYDEGTKAQLGIKYLVHRYLSTDAQFFGLTGHL